MLLLFMVLSYTCKRFIRASVTREQGSCRLLFRILPGVCLSIYYGTGINIKLFLNNNFQVRCHRCVEYAKILYMYSHTQLYILLHILRYNSSYMFRPNCSAIFRLIFE
jgi:hypothetical protein